MTHVMSTTIFLRKLILVRVSGDLLSEFFLFLLKVWWEIFEHVPFFFCLNTPTQNFEKLGHLKQLPFTVPEIAKFVFLMQ